MPSMAALPRAGLAAVGAWRRRAAHPAWRGQFTVEAMADNFAVRTPTFQSVNDFVAAQLAQPNYAHFIRSTNPGGTDVTKGAHQADPTPPPNTPAPPQPKTLGEAVILHMQSIKGNVIADPRLDLS